MCRIPPVSVRCGSEHAIAWSWSFALCVFLFTSRHVSLFWILCCLHPVQSLVCFPVVCTCSVFSPSLACLLIYNNNIRIICFSACAFLYPYFGFLFVFECILKLVPSFMDKPSLLFLEPWYKHYSWFLDCSQWNIGYVCTLLHLAKCYSLPLNT